MSYVENPELNTVLVIIVIATLALVSVFVILCRRANVADWQHVWVNLIDGFNRIMSFRFHRLQHDHIPLSDKGGAILVCNHASGLDPLLMIAACKRPLRFMVAREECERFGLQWLFRAIGGIPVERNKRPEQALRAALKTLQEGEVIAIFPHGRIHLDTDPPRKLMGGAVWLSQQTGVPIIPLRLTGIKGQGYTLLALFMRSRARLQCLPIIHCEAMDTQSCLSQIADCIEGRGSDQATP